MIEDRKLRVAHVITRMIVGGAQENTYYNCQDLSKIYGDDVLLITGPALGPEGDLFTRSSDKPAFTVEVVPNLIRAVRPWTDYVAYRRIREILKAFRPDVVHTHSAKGGILGRFAAHSLGTPAILHSVHGAPIHSGQNFFSRSVFRFCEQSAAKRCHKMICVADAMTDLMVNEGVAPREKFETVYSGMDVDPFLHANETREATRKSLGFSREDVVVGKIARLFHLKGHDDLVSAAAKAVQVRPELRFLLVGDGLLRRDIESKIESLGLRERFRFTGLINPSEIPRMCGAMDILVHTSLREGLARALPQALLAGKPVISYDIDGAREVCKTGVTGVLVAPRDLKALEKAIIELAADPQKRSRYGMEGRALCESLFRHENMTKRIREIYLEVLEKK